MADTLRLAFLSFSATNAGFFTVIEEKLFERTRPHPGGHRLVLGESLLESSELLCWNQPRTCGGGVHVIDGEITAGKSRLA